MENKIINKKMVCMLILLVVIPLGFSLDETFKVDESKDFKFNLVYSNGSYVTGYDCYNTLFYPNESILINNESMTYNFYDNLYNISYNLSESGVYNTRINCYGLEDKQYFFTVEVVEDYPDNWFNIIILVLIMFSAHFSQ